MLWLNKRNWEESEISFLFLSSVIYMKREFWKNNKNKEKQQQQQKNTQTQEVCDQVS